ncbi:hypothetical protein CQR50_0187 [Bifidobacterium pseudolongum subsp. globosum]|uniref:Uncharacterized protein n=1 Tax=Bifidobacterium pseudolongum subsp. globosum TaxID=1690 RepID=A0A2N3R6E3_9BIFI|nr:hypothetical protein CQR50_0187 [Bifidobacterium pseudolongum subsp. globosum]
MKGPVSRAAVALIRRWRRNMFSLCAVLFCAVTFVALQGITLGTGERTAQRFVAMQTGTVIATLPASSWGSNEAELLARLEGMPHVEHAGTLVMGEAVGSGVDVSSWGFDPSRECGHWHHGWIGSARCERAIGIAVRGCGHEYRVAWRTGRLRTGYWRRAGRS